MAIRIRFTKLVFFLAILLIFSTITFLYSSKNVINIQNKQITEVNKQEPTELELKNAQFSGILDNGVSYKIYAKLITQINNIQYKLSYVDIVCESENFNMKALSKDAIFDIKENIVKLYDVEKIIFNNLKIVSKNVTVELSRQFLFSDDYTEMEYFGIKAISDNFYINGMNGLIHLNGNVKSTIGIRNLKNNFFE